MENMSTLDKIKILSNVRPVIYKYFDIVINYFTNSIIFLNKKEALFFNASFFI